jgi:hypothetical protein
MHDNRELPRHGDFGSTHAGTFGHPEAPGFKSRPFLATGQQHVCGLVEIGPDERITAFGDATAHISFTRLIAFWRKAEKGPDVARFSELAWIFDGGDKGQGGQDAHTGMPMR